MFIKLKISIFTYRNSGSRCKEINLKINEYPPESGKVNLFFIMENFIDIKGFEGIYQISNLGNVKSFKYGKEKILKACTNTTGYFQFCLILNKKSFHFLQHRLISEAFIPNPENKCDINHINGIKKDNRIVNLEWNTRSENLYHAFANGLSKKRQGVKHKMAKLNNEDVYFIRESKLKQYQLAIIFNVDQSLISYVKSKKIWNHI